MKSICERMQERLSGGGLEALRDDPTALRHLEECAGCSSRLAALGALDQALGALPDHDAPDDAVGRLLEKVEKEGASTRGERGRLAALAGMAAGWWRPRRAFWATAAAAAAVAFVGWVVPALYQARQPSRASSPALDARPRGVFTAPVEGPREAEEASSLEEDFRAFRLHVPAPGSGPDEPVSEVAPSDLAFEVTGGVSGYLKQEEERKRVAQTHGAGEPARPKDTKEQDRLLDQLTEGAETYARLAPLEEPHGVPVADPRANEVPAGDGLGKADAVGPSDRDRQQEALELEVKDTVEVIAESPLVNVSPAKVRGVTEDPGGASSAGPLAEKTFHVDPEYPREAIEAGIEGTVTLQIRIAVDGTVIRARPVKGDLLLSEAAVAAVRKWRYEPRVVDGRAVPVMGTVSVTFELPDEPADDRGGPGVSHSPTRAGEFLARRSSTEGLVFREARGYWANTYVPGDPGLRMLQARLAAWDRSTLEAAAGVPLRLHDRSHQTAQPFDPPRHGALSLFAQADRRGIAGPTRMLVQIGLQGSERAASRRPAMNVALVLDMRGELPLDVAAVMRAVALALARAREAGDRFQLVVAGRAGGVAVGPRQFRHGPVSVTLARLLEGTADGERLDLEGALAAAIEAVSEGDDPSAPLGSSSVVFVTGQPMGAAAPGLARLAHRGAVAGIPTSVVSVGPNVPLPEMDRLALAGQGSCRLLGSRSDAHVLVERELASAARVVARAVRLRIRLAPGVRLVEVVGSRPLGEHQIRRVREAERSIDRRLSRNLGIEADRGEDDDGIQIVIPSFQAGDGHAILLDVVAPGPGPIAEVVARYKDVVELRNGVARASLQVSGGRQRDGGLERNVLKNLLAIRLSETLTRAGELLRGGDTARAAALLEDARRLRAGLGARRPDLSGDPELGEDVAMLGEYVRLLQRDAALRPEDRVRLVDSLRYAGSLKVLPRPAAVAGRDA